jgi:hypothetical protein
MSNIPDINSVKGSDILSVSQTVNITKSSPLAETAVQSSGFVKDINSISEISSYLSEAKIDITSSNASYDGSDLTFNLTFKKNSGDYITAGGSYDSIMQRLSFGMDLNFKRYVIEDGVMKEKPFVAEVNYTADDVGSVSIQQSDQRDDVYRFLSKILTRIFEIAGNQSKNVTGTTFNINDLIDLAQVGDLKTSKMVRELINIAIFTAQLKQMIKEKGKGTEDSAAVSQTQMEINNNLKTDYNTDDFTISVAGGQQT